MPDLFVELWHFRWNLDRWAAELLYFVTKSSSHSAQRCRWRVVGEVAETSSVWSINRSPKTVYEVHRRRILRGIDATGPHATYDNSYGVLFSSASASLDVATAIAWTLNFVEFSCHTFPSIPFDLVCLQIFACSVVWPHNCSLNYSSTISCAISVSVIVDACCSLFNWNVYVFTRLPLCRQSANSNQKLI